jgi:hypothetical protein
MLKSSTNLPYDKGLVSFAGGKAILASKLLPCALNERPKRNPLMPPIAMMMLANCQCLSPRRSRLI